MKKKVLWLAVLLAIVGTSAVFAELKDIHGSRKGTVFLKNGLVQLVPAMGRLGSNAARPISDLTDFTVVSEAKTGARSWDKATYERGMKRDGHFMVQPGWTMTGTFRLDVTLANSTTSVFVYKATIRTTGDTASTVNLVYEGGDSGHTVRQDGDVRAEMLLSFISCVDEAKIAKWVNGLKSKYPNKDDLVKHIISVKSAKGGFLGALAGIGGAIAAPVSAVGEINKWIVQAEMAWAIAYVYGYEPSTMGSEFMNDMGILLGDDSASKSAFKSATSQAPKEMTKSLVKTMSSQQMGNFKDKLVSNLTKKLGSKVMKGTVGAFAVAQNAIDAAINANDNKKFGEKAQKFYKN